MTVTDTNKLSERSTKHEALTQTLLEMARGLQAGDRFPSQSELRQRFGVSDRTVLRSLQDLERAGWIVRRPGSGTFVTHPNTGNPPSRTATGTGVIAALALTPGPARYFYQFCIDHLSVHAVGKHFSLVCHHAPTPDFYPDVLALEALHPQGFVVFNYTLEPVALRLQERGHRVVIAGTPPADVYPRVPTVYGDHEIGGYLATQRLLELGHKRLVFIRSTHMRAGLLASLRWKGHRRALRESGIEDEPLLLDSSTLALWRDDPALAARFFRQPNAPTGIVAWNDSDATMILGLLRNGSIRVPEDVSLVGYDALPEGAESRPRITTVDQHIDHQMRSVVDLLTRPTPPPPTQTVVVVPTLIPHESCAPPPKATTGNRE
ncbi:MAG: GntR family transcriptional regulator [Armatimonadota bacterium]